MTQPGIEVPNLSLPAGPKRLAMWLAANSGWHIYNQMSETAHEPVLRANAGKPTKENPLGTLKGSIKTPAHTRTHYTVQATLIADRKRIAYLWTTWEQIDGKMAFKGALHWDLVTNERYVDYQVTAFHDWLRILAPKSAPTVRIAKIKPTINEQLLGGEEWQA